MSFLSKYFNTQRKIKTIEEDAEEFVDEEREQNKRLTKGCLNTQDENTKKKCKEYGFSVRTAEEHEKFIKLCDNTTDEDVKKTCIQHGYNFKMGGKKRRVKKSRKLRKSRHKNHKKRATRRK